MVPPGSPILNVDDNETTRYLRTRALRSAGFAVEEAASGREALERVLSDRPRLVLLDVKLPDMSGFEVCRRIKADPRTSSLPVLQVSACFTCSRDRAEGLKSGADGYLVEPLDPEELIASVKSLLRTWEAEEALRRSNKRLALLSDAASRLLASDKPEEFVSTLFKEVSSLLDLEICLNYLVSPDGRRLQLNSCAGIPDEIRPQLEWLDFGEAVCGWVAQHRRRMVVQNLQDCQDSRTALIRDLGIKAYGCHPLMARGRLIGTLAFGTRKRPEFDPDELDLMNTISSQVAVALERSRLLNEMESNNAKLLQANSTLRVMLETMPAGVVTADAKSRLINYFNRKAEEIIGTPLNGDAAGPGKGYRILGPKGEVFPSESLPLMRALSRGEPVENVELRVETSAGREAAILASAAPIFDPEGNIAGAVATLQDVTERKRIEQERERLVEQLAAERALLEAVLRQMPAGVIVTDASGKLVLGNERFEQILGRSFAPMERVDCFRGRRCLHPDGRPYRPDESPIVRSLKAGEVVCGEEIDILRTDGSRRTVQASSAPVRDREGRIMAAVTTVYDISERKEAEQALRESEHHLRKVLDGIFAFVGVLTPDGNVVQVNRAALDVASLRAADVTGKVLDETYWFSYSPAVQHEVRTAVQRAARGEKVRFDVRGRVGENRFIVIDLSIAPMYDADGRISHLIPCGVDITERRRVEEQLRQAQKMEAMGRLAGGVAHDFNNLLTIITGYSQMLLEDLPPRSPCRVSLDQIIKAADRAVALTSQLLTFGRRQVMQPTVLDLNAAVLEVQKMLARVIGEHIELATDLEPGLDSVKGDAHRIEQVILNLAINARDAMPDGGKLAIRTRNACLTDPEICRELEVTPGRHVMLSISDTGRGIDAETRSHLFEPFFTTKEPGKGTGLGLSTVYGIVKQHGGAVRVLSDPGLGATFEIYFPSVDPEPCPGEAPAAAATLPRGNETILLVEDEPQVRRMVKRVLERHGYKVLEAGSGQEALQLFEQRSGAIDLLLTDVIMAKMSGCRLAERLTALDAKLKTVYMSGYTSDLIAQVGALKPGVAFLQKPFTWSDLVRKIRELLDPEKA